MVASQSSRVKGEPMGSTPMSWKKSGVASISADFKIELEDAEAADVLHEAQKFGGALQLRLAHLAAVDEIVQGFGERIELIAAALGGGLGVAEVDELFAQPRDPRGEIVRERPPEGREHDEHVEGDQSRARRGDSGSPPRATRSLR